MIEVKNLTKNYLEEYSALLNLNFKTDKRPTVIVGEEGAGKTTLLNIIAGLDKEYLGEVFFDGVERKTLSLKDVKVSYITENPILFEGKSVYCNLEYVFKTNGKFLKDEVMQKIKEVCEALDLFGILDKKVKKCNLFEKRMICIARAILKNASVILVDEPFLNLLKFESVSLWQALLFAQGKLSSELVVSVNGQNSACFEGCNIIKLDCGTKID